MTRVPHRAAAAALAIAAAGLSAPPAPGQDAAGSVSGRLGQDAASWTVVTAQDDARSAWSETADGRRVRLAAVAGPSAGAGDGRLTITFEAAGFPTEPEARDIRVALAGPDGGRRWLAEGENVDLSLTAMAAEGGALALAGSLVARLTPGGADGLALEGDVARMRILDGNFQATIAQAAPAPGGAAAQGGDPG